MKRLLTLATLVMAFSFTLFVATPGFAGATDVFQACNSGGSTSAVCTDSQAQKNNGNNPIIGGIKIIIHIIALVVGIASIITIIASGLRLVSSGGDPQAVAGARNGIAYAAVGIFVVILAEALVAFVLNKLQ